jgi:hypothetical protein
MRLCALQQTVALFKEENEVCLHPHQAFGASATIEISVDQPLHLEGLKANISSDTGDILLQTSEIPVYVRVSVRRGRLEQKWNKRQAARNSVSAVNAYFGGCRPGLFAHLSTFSTTFS